MILGADVAFRMTARGVTAVVSHDASSEESTGGLASPNVVGRAMSEIAFKWLTMLL